MAPINAEVRAVLEKRALKKFPIDTPKGHSKERYKDYIDYLASRNISPSAVEETISTGVKGLGENNSINYTTKELKVSTNIFGDVITVHRV